MTTARNILQDLASFTDLDLPTCRLARMAVSHLKIAQWQLLAKKDVKSAMRAAALATKCLARSLEAAAKEAREEVDQLQSTI